MRIRNTDGNPVYYLPILEIVCIHAHILFPVVECLNALPVPHAYKKFQIISDPDPTASFYTKSASGS